MTPVFSDFMKQIYGNTVKIMFPKRGMVSLGIMESHLCKEHPSGLGYCVILVLWYIEMVLSNPNFTRKEINNSMYELVKKKPELICRMIRGYSQFVNKDLKLCCKYFNLYFLL